MKYSPRFFQETMPEWKRKKDCVIAQVIHRPISFLFSSLFAEIGLTPNHVSFMAFLIAVAACILLCSGRTPVLIWGFVLVNLWSIVDSADGNMARSLGGKPYGDFIDATSSYFLYGVMFLSLGLSVYRTGGAFFRAHNGMVLMAGAVAGMSDTMTRLFFQKMKNNTYEIRMEKMNREDLMETTDVIDRTNSRIGRLQSRVDAEFSCGGTVHLLFLILCILLHAVDLYVLLYFLYNGLTFIASVIYLVRKTGCLKK